MSGFAEALPDVLAYEGGYVDDPDDRGGATNRGVTQAVYDDWRNAHDQPARSVRQIDESEVEAIYHQRYWVAAKCDALPWPAAKLHFDAAVNHGVVWAIKLLQRAADASDDGVFGPLTHAAVRARGHDLIGRMFFFRTRYYVDIVRARRSQAKFLPGWIQRIRLLYEDWI